MKAKIWSIGKLYLPLADGDPQTVPKAMIGASATRPQIEKVEVTYTPDIAQLLSSLTVPLAVVHTVDPREAQESFPKWLVSVKKELISFDHAVKKRSSRDEDVVCDLREGRAKLVPMKIVYTAKPPTDEAALQGEFYRRKAHCGLWEYDGSLWGGYVCGGGPRGGRSIIIGYLESTWVGGRHHRCYQRLFADTFRPGQL